MKNRTMVTVFLAFFIAIPNVSRADDWPQFHGIKRDAKSAETGLLKSWPEGGPKLLVTISDLGLGYSAPSVVGGKIYVTAEIGSDLILFCFDMNGTKLWEIKHGPAFTGQHPGARSAPTIEGNRLYLFSGVGLLAAYDLDTRQKIWEVDTVKEFGGRVPTWAYAESVLIDGNNVICTPGGPEAFMVALNKNTHETVWKAKTDNPEESASYSSPCLFEWGGVRQISVLTNYSMVGVAADDGRFLWRYDRPSNTAYGGINPSTPLFVDGVIFAASGYGRGGGAAKLIAKDGRFEVQQVWETTEMKAQHGGYVYVDGYIYGNNDAAGWTCIKLDTGDIAYQAKGVGKGSITYADGMLYTLSENGKMGLVPATPKEHKVVSEFMIPNAGPESWPHPVISDGKLFLRHHDKLFIYDIKEPAKTK